MTKFRELVNQKIEESALDEGIKDTLRNALAGAAVAGTLATAQPALAQDVNTSQLIDGVPTVVTFDNGSPELRYNSELDAWEDDYDHVFSSYQVKDLMNGIDPYGYDYTPPVELMPDAEEE